ncbi:hypothetical protein E1A91_A06G139800v1 [Gossypium mustelinum]|uniref:Uncharacterized protein n=3 Tax=Gossypium TaxID=3633 RepID=A0A5D2YX25_GOSMU|nr:hypothetical protein ES319_A06G139100v1 [Gossypium barbadense]TYH13655.1 hypothetical protein ES288_A06G156200v1 [Gossypium darwinii]TYJ30576.1 hypothetical protein E1A91_A06G139800v1 [Gossypium mustelinum]TYJ30578.1 hypothetical protein E1A91_A06G139800v1 [Gossypium mustelinum]TYJ30579.1 hypothetical protein E1A91_A06G139800v1 [Gossypium mustelinum]
MQWTKLLLLPIPSSSSTFQSGASSKLRFLSTSIAATFGIPYLKNTYCFCQRPSLANWCPTSLADLFTCIKGISFQPPAFVNLNLSTSSMPTHKPLFPPQKAKESSQSSIPLIKGIMNRSHFPTRRIKINQIYNKACIWIFHTIQDFVVINLGHPCIIQD